MRALSDAEKSLISRMAEKLPEKTRSQIMNDLSNAAVEFEYDKGSIVVLKIAGYERPADQSLKPFAVDGLVKDTDGEKIDVILHGDVNERLFQLELLRYAKGDIIGPDWNTLQLY